MDKINRLKKLRLDRGISQEKCAKDTNISISSIKRYEKEGVIGNAYNLKRLAQYYCVDMDYIYNPNEVFLRNEEKTDGITGDRNHTKNGSRNA